MSADFRRRTGCALCTSASLRDVLSLAPTPPANEFVSGSELDAPQSPIPLTLLLCEACGHVQLAEVVDPVRLFGKYVYVSGTSPVFVRHFAEYAEKAIARFGLTSGSRIVEVGSNDGTLLRQFKERGLPNVLGIDPAADIARAARESGIPTREAFFTPAVATEIRATEGPADLITANNVFAHAEDLESFARAVHTLLSDDGVFVFEVSYLVDVVEKLLFDTIYHEHLSYHAVGPLLGFFDRLGMRLFDAERIGTHGGSLRGYACRKDAKHARAATLDALVEHERAVGVASASTFTALKQRISERGEELRTRLTEARARGERVCGFGAPAKLTTLMYEFGLTKTEIDFIIDDSEWKQGRYTPGTHIPVVPSSQLYERPTQRCVVFAWNFADSIITKHARYREQGGRFLVPLPELREI
jgi:SAM-dependent methyltransferase